MFIELVGKLIVAVEIDVAKAGANSFSLAVPFSWAEFVWLTELRKRKLQQLALFIQ